MQRFFAFEHRGAKTQPAGLLLSAGAVPGIPLRGLPLFFQHGTAPARAVVQGCKGAEKTFSEGPSSIILPEYIISIFSQKRVAIERSCDIKRIAVPNSWFIFFKWFI